MSCKHEKGILLVDVRVYPLVDRIGKLVCAYYQRSKCAACEVIIHNCRFQMGPMTMGIDLETFKRMRAAVESIPGAVEVVKGSGTLEA